MAGVIHTLAPQARILDLTNEIPRGDVQTGAFMLWQASPYFPAGTVFLVVVDPGVGGTRRAIVASWPERIVVGPDNGLISFLIARDGEPQLIEIEEPAGEISSTFHGRDVFAPAAAHIASGLSPNELGGEVSDPVTLSAPRLELSGSGGVSGEIVRIDPFGNLVTSIGTLEREPGGLRLTPWLDQAAGATIPGSDFHAVASDAADFPLHGSFSDVPAEAQLAYIGSSGLLELAVNQGNAAESFGIRRGDTIELLAEH